MKNIHVLKTDKPSRIIKGQDNVFILLDTYAPNWFEINLKTTKQNIYITNDERIKEGGWFYNTISLKPEPFKACENGDGYVNCSRYSHNRIDCKKIILTTDQDLIKDGVQAIDDKFLESFVKNPSCERVDIMTDAFTVKEMSILPIGTRNLKYKIIIPKEEPKKYKVNEAKANALLISKAPEMLEMLKEMFDEWCETGIGENQLSEYMLKAKQLIKEATEI